MSLRFPLLPAFSLVALFSPISIAALRPLTQEERVAQASDIVTGYVRTVKKQVHQKGTEFSDAHYAVQMIVTDIEKGNNVAGGELLKFHFWKELERPRGWAGDAGQSGVIKHYQIIKAYLKFDETKNTFQLLEPNGFDLIQK